MAQLILSNRLKGFQDALGEFGQTWGQQRQLKLNNKRMAEQDAIAAQAAQRAGETHALQMKQGQLALSEAERARAAGLEQQSLADQLAQADTGQVMGPSAQGDFQAGLEDPWAPMKDRLRAKMFTAAGKPMTAGDVKKEREDQAFKSLTLREAERRANESHASQLKNDEATRAKGAYTPFVLNGNELGAFNTRTGTVAKTGEQAQPKPAAVGSQKDVVVKGETLIPNLEPIQGVEITKDSVKKVKDSYAAYQAFKNQLDEYKALVGEQGAELTGEKADRADALVTDMGLKLKGLQDLGVLTGNDWQLMMKQIPSSTGLGATLKSGAYSMIGQNAFGPRLNVISQSVDDKFKTFAETNGFRIAKQGGGASGSFGQPSGQPKPGTVEDGYRFKGGNPSDPNNWEAVQ